MLAAVGSNSSGFPNIPPLKSNLLRCSDSIFEQDDSFSEFFCSILLAAPVDSADAQIVSERFLEMAEKLPFAQICSPLMNEVGRSILHGPPTAPNWGLPSATLPRGGRALKFFRRYLSWRFGGRSGARSAVALAVSQKLPPRLGQESLLIAECGLAI